MQLLYYFTFIYILLLIQPEAALCQSSFAADITTVVIDLKYNQKDGVKICEIQPFSESRVVGYEFLNKRAGILEEKFCAIVRRYLQTDALVFFKPGLGPDLIKTMNHYGWKEILEENDLKQSFEGPYPKILKDLTDLKNYQGAVYLRPLNTFKANLLPFAYRNIFLMSPKEFYAQYPHLLLLDAAIFPYIDDKLLMSQLLSLDSTSSQLRPKWNNYEKVYDPLLAEKIRQDIPSDFLVIKPRALAGGRGVFIVHQEELDDLLKKLLASKKSELKGEPGFVYMNWLRDKKETFLVEEFIPSDPLVVSHLSHQSYDPTMRVVATLVYNKNKVAIHFLGAYWKLPKYSLTSSVGITAKYKSYGRPPYFAEVDSKTFKEVKKQLKKGLQTAYENMLMLTGDQ